MTPSKDAMNEIPERTPQSPVETRRPAVRRRSFLTTVLPYVILVLIIVALPMFFFKPSAEGRNYHLSILVFIGINTILAVGLNLLMGYAGQVSLGHAAFYGIGAYASAILTKQFVPQTTVAPASAALATIAAAAALIAILRMESYRLGASVAGFIAACAVMLRYGPRHWLPYAVAVVCVAGISAVLHISMLKLAISYALGAVVGFATLALLNHTLASQGISPWYAMLAGALFSCLVAYLLGVQALRLQGYYLAMATLGFGVIVSIILLQWDTVTGGTSGVYGIPSLQMAGKPLDNDIRMYCLVWGIAVLFIALSANVVNSRVGRAFRAVHGSELAASSLGVDTARYKVQVFVVSAGLAAIAGSLYAHYVTFISPQPFGFKFSIELVVMVVVGGLASVWGAIFGAGVITALARILGDLGEVNILGHQQALSDFDVILFGLILMLIMIYAPSGVVRGALDLGKSAVGLVRRKKDPGAPARTKEAKCNPR